MRAAKSSNGRLEIIDCLLAEPSRDEVVVRTAYSAGYYFLWKGMR